MLYIFRLCLETAKSDSKISFNLFFFARKPFNERLSAVTMVESVTLGILLKKIRPSILALADKAPGYEDVNWA